MGGAACSGACRFARSEFGCLPQAQFHEVSTMKIGWIGTGIMGASMAGHLQFAGHELFLYNRTRDKAKPLIDRGGRWCPTPAAVAAEAEVAFTMVGTPADVEETYLGPQGVFAAEPKCRIVVDMTTSEPALARRIAKVALCYRFKARLHLSLQPAPLQQRFYGRFMTTEAFV